MGGRTDVRREFAGWLATPKRLKVSLDLPLTEKAFAELKGVDPRTLRRWKQDPEFDGFVEQEKLRVAGEARPGSALDPDLARPRPAKDARVQGRLEGDASGRRADATDDPEYREDLTPEELEFRQIRSTLANLAKDGQANAIDLWLKHWGKPFLQADADDGLGLSGLSDDELIDEAVALLGPERLARALADSM